MLEAITLEGSNISADLDAYLHHYIYGYDGVLNNGGLIKAEIINNNLIKIKDGLMINQGRFIRIVPGSYEEIQIDNGTSGTTRTDLIVSHFETDGINEIHDIRVLKGEENGIEPTPTKSDIFNGGTINELPLYAVKISGINIESVTPKFILLPSINDIKNGALFYISESDESLIVGDYEEYLKSQTQLL